MDKSTVPKLALGTWLMGGTKDPDPKNDDKKDISVIRLAIEQGITLIDTAQNYAAGKCEELVGKAVKKLPRDSYQILTKQNKANLDYAGVIRGCKESLQRLGINYIDYFVCHAPNVDFDTRDFFKASNQLYKDGFIRHVGVSNFGPRMLQLAMDTSDLPISLNQVSFSLVDNDIITTGTYDFCVKNDIPIQAYRTLVSLKENDEVANTLKEVAKANNISIQQAALAYLNSYKGVIFTIHASSKKHWDEIKQSLKIQLPDDDIQKLKKVHKNQKGLFRDFLYV